MYARSSLHVPVPVVTSLFVILVLTGCIPASSIPGISTPHRASAQIESTLPATTFYAHRELPEAQPWFSLEGRQTLDPSDLSSDQRRWLDRLHRAIEASQDDMLRRAGSDNTYYYGRWLFQYTHALLLGLRMTGDLRLLDYVDEIAEAMRAELRDEWCGSRSQTVDVNIRYGTVTSPDGYLNFRLRNGGGRDHCRDTGDLDETLVHGHLASLMYSYHANRHLSSPAGIDYGERADFWLDYLRNHFEKKWRARSATEWPAMDFIDQKFCHTFHQMALFYYFVGKRLQEEGSSEAGPYLRQVMRMTDGMFEVPYIPGQQPGGFVDVETLLGDAVIYSFGAPGATEVNPTHLEACPITYARYMLTSILVLRLEAFYRWDDDIMTKLATGFAYYVIDSDSVTARSDPFAAGVTGDADVEGIPRTEYRGRNTASRFALSPFAAYSVWDDSGKIAATSLEVYSAVEADEDWPRQVFIPASMLFVHSVKDKRE